MDIIGVIRNVIDPVLIFPYRMFENPVAGWCLGTFVLSLWSVVIGEITLMVAGRINQKAVSDNLERTLHYHDLSLRAKQAGDEASYQGINRLANESYGKSFFLLMSMGMAGLWPAFFAAAWLDMRFGNFKFPLPGWLGGLELSFIAPFILFYILQRFAWSRVKKRRLET